jgi:ankyrin repeat protein
MRLSNIILSLLASANFASINSGTIIPRFFFAPVLQTSSASNTATKNNIKIAKNKDTDQLAVTKETASNESLASNATQSNPYIDEMFYAIESNNEERLEAELLKENCNVNAKNQNDQTPLMKAVWSLNLRMLQMLLEKEEINVNAQDQDGTSALLLSCSRGCRQIVDALLKKKDIDVNLANNNKTTPLSLAIERGHKEIVVKLLNHSSIEVNKPINDGYTPLILAVQDDQKEIAQLLVEHKKIDINARAANNASALHWAVSRNNTFMVELLLTHKDINTKARDKYKLTAQQKAQQKGLKEIEKILQEYDSGKYLKKKKVLTEQHVPKTNDAEEPNKDYVESYPEQHFGVLGSDSFGNNVITETLN